MVIMQFAPDNRDGTSDMENEAGDYGYAKDGDVGRGIVAECPEYYEEDILKEVGCTDLHREISRSGGEGYADSSDIRLCDG